MTHTLANLRSLFGLRKATPPAKPRPAQSRNVMMRITLDAEQATPVRQALIRDCAGQPWTIRVAPLHSVGRVRLSLYLPRHAVDGAMRQVAELAPSAQWTQLLDVPDAPTDAWRELTHPAPTSRSGRVSQSDEADTNLNALAQLLREDHVLLNANVATKDALFSLVAGFVEHHYGFPAANIAAGLTAREALGSTGLGQGVAVPHGQINGLRDAMALYVRPAVPIPFDAPDGAPVSNVVVLLVPEWANSTHLHLLADVAQRFCDHQFRALLDACTDAQAVCALFSGYDCDEAGIGSTPAMLRAHHPRASRG